MKIIVEDNEMIVDKSTKRVSVGNTEIQKIMSGGYFVAKKNFHMEKV